MTDWERFEAFAERQAAAFRERYGLAETDAWTDEQLGRALADHGYPPLASLPDEPRGMLAGMQSPTDRPGDWQRANAGHLVAHAMLHAGRRCGGCADWG
jgi:hypothetical protein